MKVQGFTFGSYALKSPNVDAQRCVNLYPEIIDSGNGKNQATMYLKSTPGLELLCEVGAGPIRLIHEDLLGTILVVSGSQLYVIDLVLGVWTPRLLSVDAASSFKTSSGRVTAASIKAVAISDATEFGYSTLFADGSDNNYIYYYQSADVVYAE